MTLVYYYGDELGLEATSPVTTAPAWELFDLVADPNELINVYDDPSYATVR